MANNKEDFFDFGDSDSREKHGKHSGFYNARKSRFGCTCGTLVILLIALFAIFVVFVVMITRRSIDIPQISGDDDRLLAADQVESQIEDGLKSSSNSISIALTEGELTSLLRQGGLSGAEATIQPEGIHVYGKVWGINSDAELVPRVAENRIVFDVATIHLGSIKAPSALGKPFAHAAENAANELAQKTSAIDISEVELYNGGMTITGQVVGR